MWLTPPLQRTNSIAAGHSARHHLRIVSRAGDEARRRAGKIRGGSREPVLQTAIAGRGRCLVHGLAIDRQAPPRGNGVHIASTPIQRREPDRIGGRAQIDGECHAAGNDVHRSGQRLDPSHGRDHAIRRVVMRDPFQRQRHLGSAGECVASHIHWHRAGVAGHAGDRDAQPRLADDAGDDPERTVQPLQHRPLLDMDLDVSQRLACAIGRRCDVVRRLAIGAKRIRQRYALRILTVERGSIEHTHAGARTRHCIRKARSLLVAEGQHLDAERQRPPGSENLARRQDAGDHAKRAVVAAGVDHGVDMRADQKLRT